MASRYGDRCDVAMGDPAPHPGSWAFVGRDRDVAELVAGLEDAAGGRGRLFLIAGEPGIGKTWLAQHLAGLATGRGTRVLWGRCWEAGGAPPFWPWAQLLGALVGEPEVRSDLGDAGALLEATAKTAYKTRLAELRAELEEAERFNVPLRATQARQEMDFLVGELARAVGLGGRDRRVASHAERARLNTTRAIRAAMANLARAHPSLGRHLASTIQTGRYCSYAPDPRAPIAWER